MLLIIAKHRIDFRYLNVYSNACSRKIILWWPFRIMLLILRSPSALGPIRFVLIYRDRKGLNPLQIKILFNLLSLYDFRIKRTWPHLLNSVSPNITMTSSMNTWPSNIFLEHVVPWGLSHPSERTSQQLSIARPILSFSFPGQSKGRSRPGSINQNPRRPTATVPPPQPQRLRRWSSRAR